MHALLLLLSYLATPLSAHDAEEQAAKAVEHLGGRVVRDFNGRARPVVGVNLFGNQVTDADLKELAALKGLRTLDLGFCKGVTNAGLKELAGLKGLQTLYLSYTQVKDAGLKELAVLTRLRELHLASTPVTDAGLKEL
ncbi:MAG TPA: hypothetical protein VG013_33820, partial [Gemmataceae bacterium]|nr:hypothetical protein [Gemmataceae bacterium]